jgi:hypothetical protein
MALIYADGGRPAVAEVTGGRTACSDSDLGLLRDLKGVITSIRR